MKGVQLILLAAVALLCAPAGARAHGDPARDYLLSQNAFLPFAQTVDRDQVKRLDALLNKAKEQHYPIKVALILSPSDLGTAYSLFNQPQKYAEFLGRELSSVYRDRLLIVMPKGFGYSTSGEPDARAAEVLERIPTAGRNATKEVAAAIVAVRRLAANERRPEVPKVGGTSGSSDRITIAAAATAGFALIAAFTLYRRQRQPAQP